ncbi:MAG: UbiX family flavin prenyltransferase [Chloroflexota bacterium]|nr:UbiX family flavin prenyltransferase [Chloroflexota bacterium]
MTLHPIIVGITGASGSIIAQSLVDELLHREIPTTVVCSNGGKLVWQDELKVSFNQNLAAWQEYPMFTYYPINDLRAPIASGTYSTGGMVIAPCSMNSLASISHGISNNLLLRAADVCLKEKRKLTIVPRETPLHSIHLENMLRLSNMGVTILPPEPAFYLEPKGVDDIVRFTISRILVSLEIDTDLPVDMQYQDRGD